MERIPDERGGNGRYSVHRKRATRPLFESGEELHSHRIHSGLRTKHGASSTSFSKTIRESLLQRSGDARETADRQDLRELFFGIAYPTDASRSRKNVREA